MANHVALAGRAGIAAAPNFDPMCVDIDDVVDRLMLWAGCFPHFSEDHARFGARLAQIIVEGIETIAGEMIGGLGSPAQQLIEDLALDIAWIFWIDDCFDLYPELSSDGLLELGDFHLQGSCDGRALEVWSAGLVAQSFRVDERPEGAWQLWLQSAVQMIQAFQRNKLSSRAEGRRWTYEDYLANGEISSAVPHFVATVSLLYNLDLHERMDEPEVRGMIRDLSLAMRLENDIVSAGNELEDGDNANSVLVMRHDLGLRGAVDFVERERASHERALCSALDSLGPDPLAQICRLVLEGAHWFHATERERYTPLRLAS
ncbi:terpene synthase family protein [Plesiocystis pacifica]|nr:terpene synthase family protein [Plesiocystis pacifica]